MEKIRVSLLASCMIFGAVAVEAQIRINIPGLPGAKPTPTPEPKATPAPTPSQTQPRPPRAGEGGISAPQSSQPAPGAQQGGDLPTWMRKPVATNQIVFRRETLEIRCDTKERYWKFPDQSYYSSWVPALRVRVLYNYETTMRLQAEWFLPDGKPWFTEPLNANYDKIETPYSNDERFKNGSVAAGVYGVKITDTRSGAVLFEGKFRVNKFKYGENTPMYKNQFGFATDFDGALPVAFVGFNWNRDAAAPPLTVGMWIKEPKNLYKSDLEARLYLNGQEIATTDDRGMSEQIENRSPNASNYYPQGRYEYWRFSWPVRYLASGSGSSYPSDRFLNREDGEYTFKVFYKGAQIRQGGFTVKGGVLVDNGHNSGAGFSRQELIVPVELMGDKDDWKPENGDIMFFGNPVPGIGIIVKTNTPSVKK